MSGKVPDQGEAPNDARAAIIEEWSWTDITPVEIERVSAFAQLIIHNDRGVYWHFDPDMFSLQRVAENVDQLDGFVADPEFDGIRQVRNFFRDAESRTGPLKPGYCYVRDFGQWLAGQYDDAHCLQLPPHEILTFAGKAAKIFDDDPDATEIRIEIAP